MDKRKHTRHRKRLKLRYREAAGPWRSAFSLDISVGGMYINATRIPTTSTIEIEIANGAAVIKLSGVVLRGKKVPFQLQAVVKGGFGVQFTEVSEQWYQFCFDFESK